MALRRSADPAMASSAANQKRREAWDNAIRMTIGLLSFAGSVALGFVLMFGAAYLADTSTVLATVLMAVVFVCTPVTGYLGYRLALRSWRQWWVWVAAMVIVPGVLIRALLFALDVLER